MLHYLLYTLYIIFSMFYYRYREEEKLAALLALVRDVIPAGRPTLIFASTRHHVDLLAQLLAVEGIPATFVYGTLDQARPHPPSLGHTETQQSWSTVVCIRISMEAQGVNATDSDGPRPGS